MARNALEILPGQRGGRQSYLTATSNTYPNPKGGHRLVDAVCACGTPVQGMQATRFNTGAIRSCGCRKGGQLDLPVGSVWGSWTVQGEGFWKEGNPYQLIPVRCACGVERVMPATRVADKKSSNSCGCARLAQIAVTSATKRAAPDSVESRLRWLYSEKSAPCLDCGQIFPPHLMQFDHILERGEKLCMINTQTVQGISLNRLQAERKKCDLICSTCHDHRSWLRIRKLPWVPWTEFAWDEATYVEEIVERRTQYQRDRKAKVNSG